MTSTFDPVIRDLNNYLAEQDNADAMNDEIERVAEELLSGQSFRYTTAEIAEESGDPELMSDYIDAITDLSIAGRQSNEALLEAAQSLWEVINKAAYKLAARLVEESKDD